MRSSGDEPKLAARSAKDSFRMTCSHAVLLNAAPTVLRGGVAPLAVLAAAAPAGLAVAAGPGAVVAGGVLAALLLADRSASPAPCTIAILHVLLPRAALRVSLGLQPTIHSVWNSA